MGPFSTTHVAEAAQAGPPLTIEESATLAGGWAWAETSLYEVVGGRAPRRTRPPRFTSMPAASITRGGHSFGRSACRRASWLPTRLPAIC